MKAFDNYKFVGLLHKQANRLRIDRLRDAYTYATEVGKAAYFYDLGEGAYGLLTTTKVLEPPVYVLGLADRRWTVVHAPTGQRVFEGLLITKVLQDFTDAVKTLNMDDSGDFQERTAAHLFGCTRG